MHFTKPKLLIVDELGDLPSAQPPAVAPFKQALGQWRSLAS
jgi:hypothetical protein